jgi:hypothetical protein
MKTLQLSDADARKLHKANIPGVKEILESTWSKQFFSASIMERVASEEDIFSELGIDLKDWTDKRISIGLRMDQIAKEKLELLTQVLNEGWKPNWNDSSERKYYAWFYMNQPGFRLGATYYGSADTLVGSRLVFKSEGLCLYAASQFLYLYELAFSYE